jgi:hypothetical protein
MKNSDHVDAFVLVQIKRAQMYSALLCRLKGHADGNVQGTAPHPRFSVGCLSLFSAGHKPLSFDML